MIVFDVVMGMPLNAIPENIKKVVLKQTGTSVLMNIFFNGLMGWLIFEPAKVLTLWQENIFAIDLIATTAFLVFFTRLFVFRACCRILHSNSRNFSTIEKSLKGFPPSPFLGAVMLSMAIALFVSAIVIGSLMLIGVDTMTLTAYISFKAVYTGVLSAILTPLVVVIALAKTGN